MAPAKTGFQWHPGAKDGCAAHAGASHVRPRLVSDSILQGYLAHKKQPQLPWTTMGPWV